MTHLLIFPSLVLNLVCTSFCWKWPASQKQLDHAVLDYKAFDTNKVTFQ